MSRAANTRAIAARAVHGVAVRHRPLEEAILSDSLDDADRALVSELAYGTVRHYFSLRMEISAHLTAPLKPRDRIIESLLLVGAYQIRHTRIPAYAAVSESVAAVGELGRPWAKRLVNAVLRAIASKAPQSSDTARDNPPWLVEHVQQDYPDTWQRLLAVAGERAPMSLRVNRRRGTREAYAERLNAQGVRASAGLGPDSLRLDAPVPVAQLPDFEQGRVSVQDEGAQLAVELVGDARRFLDACAAPGGKAFHRLERYPATRLTALDIDADRCARMRSECRRLDIDPGIVVGGDALEHSWWDGEAFDAILIDAPCSGTGTLRRHPDIRLLKRAEDLPAFHSVQSRLLANLWPLLAPGGTMIYCTCSILGLENDSVIEKLVAGTPDAEPKPIETSWGIATVFGRQLVPVSGGPDGFYYARVDKRPS